MFNLDFLRQIREFEYAMVLNEIKRMPQAERVLEIGGGSGYQARRLSEDGYTVFSIDVEGSIYRQEQEFSVSIYDGSNIPFPDGSFDLVYSSNCLEHVKNFSTLQREIVRVMKPHGQCLHLMPTASWRFWTSLAHYVELSFRVLQQIPRLWPKDFSLMSIRDSFAVLRLITGLLRQYAVVPRHGEFGNAFTELWWFCRFHWRLKLRRSGFVIKKCYPAGLFYTGHMILGQRCSIRTRAVLSRILGSSCLIYVLNPIDSYRLTHKEEF